MYNSPNLAVVIIMLLLFKLNISWSQRPDNIPVPKKDIRPGSLRRFGQ